MRKGHTSTGHSRGRQRFPVLGLHLLMPKHVDIERLNSRANMREGRVLGISHAIAFAQMHHGLYGSASCYNKPLAKVIGKGHFRPPTAP